MCRHLGYVGPPRSVAEVLTGQPHSLLTQSYAPTDMRRGGTVNADGFGAAWSAPDGSMVSYRNAMPMWTDPAVTDVLTQVTSTCVLGAVRSATVGMPIVRTANAPFVDGRFAFSHNGVVAEWPTSMAALAAQIPTEDLMTLEAPTDSASVWALLKVALREHGPGRALRTVATAVDSAAPNSRLNFLLGDGEALYATAVYHSLSVYSDDECVMVASEPLDFRPGWQSVPNRSFVTARIGNVDVQDL
ncbi:gamma-glutamyl-hercynylcysteine sulfoxide hydrolase [Rhodococcoides trifolii]|uniref:Gamma-glutamyl-hercynylcysteine sulfoxide hydrolase n=1 Tax=Rhodococcoides trifolii TaxID=908250 RepID=A0A917G0U3_9NOCA|nr:ergothioneine biosynthesis protein EgtC [Rhodococcus trifolii]GGG16825.1 gamma-glutamyl-hercynylcysteine sulfoxide hydrolase [Rhodococcus trifolii]